MLNQIYYSHTQKKEIEIMSKSVTRTIQKFGLEQAFNYLYKDPDKNMLRIMDWADKFAGHQFVSQRKNDP